MVQKRIWSWGNIILMIVLLAVIVLIILQNTSMTGNSTRFSITGHPTEDTTVSNVSIQYYLSIALCENLSEGITFGDVSTLPATDINGSHNYDGTSSGSTYCVNVSTDSNTAVDFCIKANWDLNNTANDKILLGNETWSNYTTTNSTHPLLTEQQALANSYADAGNSIAIGSLNYYRFWLDIPAGQASGDYDNVVYFKGVTTGNAC